MKAYRISHALAVVVAELWGAQLIANGTTLNGRVGQYTAYQTEENKFRHHRYHLYLNQNAEINESLTSRIEGRMRYESALDPIFGAMRHIDKTVRHDEHFEAEARQAYFDFLNDMINVRIGIQKIDWTESLSPRTNDLMASVDLRHFGTGPDADSIEPIGALNISHKTYLGTLEWLLIPYGSHHRLPKAENDYGYYAYLTKEAHKIFPEARVEFKSEEIPKTNAEMELGLRWLYHHDESGWEYSVFGFRGHQRLPVLKLAPSDATTLLYTQTFPKVNTFGASAVWGGEAWVFRLQAYYQPLREPNLFYVGTPQDPREQQYENRQILGLGADFVHSKHFKIYTEHYLTHTLSFAEHERRKNQRQVVPEGDSTYEIQNTVRTTNESIEDVKLSLDVTLAGPKTGLSFTPLASYRAGDFLWSIGGNYFNSIQSDSKFAPVDGHSLVFVQVESYFDAKGWGQSESSQ